MPATTDRHRITVAWNVRFDNTCQPLAAPFTWPAFFWRCSGLILKDCRPSVKHGNTNVLIGVDTHKHVMQHASLKEQYQPWKKLFFEIWISVHYTALSLFFIPYLRKRISQSSWLDYCSPTTNNAGGGSSVRNEMGGWWTCLFQTPGPLPGK